VRVFEHPWHPCFASAKLKRRPQLLACHARSLRFHNAVCDKGIIIFFWTWLTFSTWLYKLEDMMYESFAHKNCSLSGVSWSMVTNTQVSYIAKSSYSTSLLIFSLQIQPFSTDCYIKFVVFQCCKMYHILKNALFC
jgi:hypothetical protein